MKEIGLDNTEFYIESIHHDQYYKINQIKKEEKKTEAILGNEGKIDIKKRRKSVQKKFTALEQAQALENKFMENHKFLIKLKLEYNQKHSLVKILEEKLDKLKQKCENIISQKDRILRRNSSIKSDNKKLLNDRLLQRTSLESDYEIRLPQRQITNLSGVKLRPIYSNKKDTNVSDSSNESFENGEVEGIIVQKINDNYYKSDKNLTQVEKDRIDQLNNTLLPQKKKNLFFLDKVFLNSNLFLLILILLMIEKKEKKIY